MVGGDVHQHQQWASSLLSSKILASSCSESSWKRSVKERINPAALPSYSTSSTLSPGNHRNGDKQNNKLDQRTSLQFIRHMYNGSLSLQHFKQLNVKCLLAVKTVESYTYIFYIFMLVEKVVQHIPLTLVFAWTNILRASFLSSTVSRRRKKL